MAKKQYEEDDGSVIAPMNIDGMPWYRKHKAAEPEMPEGDQPRQKMTPAEGRAFLSGAMKATLLVTGVFVGVYFLVILILYLVW